MAAPVTFKDSIDLRGNFELFKRSLASDLSKALSQNGQTNGTTTSEGPLIENHENHIKDFRDYVLGKGESSWLLDASMAKFIGAILNDKQNLHSNSKTKNYLIRILSGCALREDFNVLLYNDRQRNHIMSYLTKFRDLSEDERRPLAKFLCNVSSHKSGCNWLILFSEWTTTSNPTEPTCNAYVTRDILRFCLFGDKKVGDGEIIKATSTSGFRRQLSNSSGSESVGSVAVATLHNLSLKNPSSYEHGLVLKKFTDLIDEFSEFLGRVLSEEKNLGMADIDRIDSTLANFAKYADMSCPKAEELMVEAEELNAMLNVKDSIEG